MARDAIARQYDVDKNSVILTGDDKVKNDKKGYQPGTITFSAKSGKSIDLEKVRASIAATRLSGGTNMSMDWLEITAKGEVLGGRELLLKISGTEQEFVLGPEPETPSAWQRLRDAHAGGTKITTVTGRVEGWKGRFPNVLREVANRSGKRTLLMVTSFEVAK